MVAPHVMGQLKQLINRVRMVSMVSNHSFAISSFQKSFLRVREFPHMKFSVCHFSSCTFISCGDPSPAKMGMTPGTGFSFRIFIYSSTSVQSCRYSAGWATLRSFVPRTTIAFTPLSPITAPIPPLLALDLPCSMEAK